jgi:alpha-glucosidase
MQWGPGPGAGFTMGKPWLPLAPDAGTRNVAAEAADPASVLSLYRRLIQARRSIPALLRGDQALVDVGDPDVLAYRRTLDGRSALVTLNFAGRTATIRPPTPSTGNPWRIALSTHSRETDGPLADPVILAPLEVLIAYD